MNREEEEEEEGQRRGGIAKWWLASDLHIAYAGVPRHIVADDEVAQQASCANLGLLDDARVKGHAPHAALPLHTGGHWELRLGWERQGVHWILTFDPTVLKIVANHCKNCDNNHKLYYLNYFWYCYYY